MTKHAKNYTQLIEQRVIHTLWATASLSLTSDPSDAAGGGVSSSFLSMFDLGEEMMQLVCAFKL
jgi:hypothetical protein